MKLPIRILLVDDHPSLRKALADRLKHERDLEVVGQAADGFEAVELAQQLRPDVVVMDIAMSGMHGIAAAEMICEHCPGIRVIGFSILADPEAASAMAEAGAFRYVSKREDPEVLITAIRAAGSAGPLPSRLGRRETRA